MKNVTFEELPGERFCPPERIYYIESHLFILEKKFLIILFSSVFLFWFGGANRLSPCRDFPCNRAVCRSPLLPALLLGVSARLLLVVMRERKWRREKRVKQRRTFRHWQPRRGTVWSGSTGRNSSPIHSHERTDWNLIVFCPCMSKMFPSRSASDSEPPMLSSCLQLTVWISEASWRWRQNEGPVDEGSKSNWMYFTTKQHPDPLDLLQPLNNHAWQWICSQSSKSARTQVAHSPKRPRPASRSPSISQSASLLVSYSHPMNSDPAPAATPCR